MFILTHSIPHTALKIYCTTISNALSRIECAEEEHGAKFAVKNWEKLNSSSVKNANL